MAKSTKKDNSESISRTKESNKSKEKITGPEELGNGVSMIAKGTTDSVFNTLAATYELTMTGASLLSEKLGSKKPEIRESRKAIRKHHFNQTKKAVSNVGNGIMDIGKGGFHTTKGAIRTVLLSGKDTIESLRDDDSEKKTKKVASKKPIKKAPAKKETKDGDMKKAA